MTTKIAVAGTGYVGLSIATLLSQHNHVVAVDVIPEKVDLINSRKSPIQDDYIEKYLAEKQLDLTATLDGASAYSDADFVVIAAPTNYDPKKNFFDTSHVEEVIDLVRSVNLKAVMVIKSTIPVGYCDSLYKRCILNLELRIPGRITDGRPQEIRFPELSDVYAGTDEEIRLNATSSSGLPVYFYVESGPAVVEGNRLILTDIPPRATFPVEVTVTAWQYGIAGQWQTAAPVKRVFRILE